jgi:ubiquitin carboxyl-terminal hydrolase 1
MDFRRLEYTRQYQHPPQPLPTSLGSTLVLGIAVLWLAHKLLENSNYPLLSPPELAWNALVFCIPQRLLLDSARRQELKANGMLSQTHAAKSDALRRMMGIGGNAILQKLPAEGIMRRASSLGGRWQSTNQLSDAPPGLGNWDNSCYQNSILQGLASLDTLKPFLQQTTSKDDEDSTATTARSLLETITKLNDPDNNGSHFWTPAKLKSMSSWQQQDAQEYFSKIVEELDKEATKSATRASNKPGLESITEESTAPKGDSNLAEIPGSDLAQNPLDGLLAQSVTCTRCGYSEGLSMIPFNCLTLPLGSSRAYDVTQCLDTYTEVEDIPEVECAKCTLLHVEKQLERMLPSPPIIRSSDRQPPIDSKTLALPPELRAQAFQRLSAIQKALTQEDFSDKTIGETCSIPKRGRASSTKTKQVVIGRAPRSLAIHFNRSVFDEMTGVQRKNYAGVSFPATLDLSPWILRTESEYEDDSGGLIDSSDTNPSSPHSDNYKPQNPVMYRIKAVVTHYGRHENGHYICYRQHPIVSRTQRKDSGFEHPEPEDDDPANPPYLHADESQPSHSEGEETGWWRLSDEDVSSVSEEETLSQHGVFMLFYERIDAPTSREPAAAASSLNIETQHEILPVEAATLTSPESAVDDISQSPSPLATASSPEAEMTEPETILTQPSTPPSSARLIASEVSVDEQTFPPLESLRQPDVLQTDTISSDHDPEESKAIPVRSTPSPPLLRTASPRQHSSPEQNHGQRRGFGTGTGSPLRPMAVT